MTKYSVTVVNNSVNTGAICIYQTSPDITEPKVMSLAWFSKVAHPKTQVSFDWSIDYSFVWDETGLLIPGVTFDASQSLPTDLSSKNMVTLDYSEGAFVFENQTKGAKNGTMYITCDGNLPLNVASVGIGMSGAGTFVVQAQPNINLNFTPHPTYWVTFGNYTPGQVLDIGEITNKQKLEFGANIYNLDVVLNRDNTWTV